MKFQEIEEFQVIGTAARTSNAREMTQDGVIPGQWAKLMQKRPDSVIVAVYTDYESDENGAYTFILGGKAAPESVAGDGMVVKTVPAGKYAVFTSERGPVQKVVVETWQRIWSQLPSAGYARSYATDFEVHDERATDPGSAVVDIYVGVN